MPYALNLKNDISELARLADSVAVFGREHRLSPETVFDLRLTLEEIFSNIVFYGFEDEADHDIRVALHLDGEKLVAEIMDDGRPFNPLAAPELDVTPPLEDRPPGGMGIHLVRHLMDSLEYRNEAGKNVLVMKKRVLVPANV